MEISDLLAAISIGVSLIIALVGGVYAVITNTKKFELSEQYKNELLTWYGKVIFIISKLQSECEEHERINAISQLSALIEIGRFYFPNIDKKDGLGKEKPCAYQGYRHVALDFLVLIYEMANSKNIDKCRSKIEYMKRHFTSIVFQIVAPRKRIKNVKQYTNIAMPKEMSIEDFMLTEYAEAEINTIFQFYK